MSSEQNKDLSRRLYEEVFGRGNLKAADEILAADCISHGPGTPSVVGTQGIKQQAMLLRTAIPDLQVTLNQQLAEGDLVANRWSAVGTHTGPMALPSGLVPPTGGVVNFVEMRIDRIVDGRIVEAWFIPDRMTLWQQLGLIPRPGRDQTTTQSDS